MTILIIEFFLRILKDNFRSILHVNSFLFRFIFANIVLSALQKQSDT